MAKEQNIFLTTCQESLLRPLDSKTRFFLAESHRETRKSTKGRQKRDAVLRPLTQSQAVPDN